MLLYAGLTRDSIATIVASAVLCGMIVLTASSGGNPAMSRRLLIEVRAVAFVELFTYASLVALLLGASARNENRLFRATTSGGDRLSFLFASNPQQAAAVAGTGMVFAVAATAQISPIRRVALAGASFGLLYGANYRTVAALGVLAVGLALFIRRRFQTTDHAQRRTHAPRWVAIGALVLAAAPMWWASVVAITAAPLTSILSNVPGLGIRGNGLDATGEIASLNNRTYLWSDTWRLLGSADSRQVIVGYGTVGGDERYQNTIQQVVGSSFRDTQFTSAHNSGLEIVRRAGLLGVALLGAGIWLFWRSRALVTGCSFVGISLLVGVSGMDTTLVPFATLPIAMFMVVCVASRSRDLVTDQVATRGRRTYDTVPR